MDLTNPLHLILTIFAGLAVLALLIWFIVFLVKPSQRRDALSLAIPFSFIGRKNRKHHVFIGISPYSKLMAAHLLRDWEKEKKKKDQGRILFVNLTDRFNPLAERLLRTELGSQRVRLFNATPSDALTLRGLRSWLANKRTSLYLFADSQQVNAQLLTQATADSSIKAKIFYYSPDPNGFDALVAATGSRVRTLNPHQMAFRHLTLQCPQLMPFNYVKKAVGTDGEPLGYVTEGLKALVIGFGNTGQEAVRFLYEFGSFVGKDFNRAPMSVKVYDPSLEDQLGAFLESAPQMKGDKAFTWRAESAGSVVFWEDFAKEHFNYIIVAMDDGPKNLQMGVALLQAAARAGQDLSSMLILMRYWQESEKTREIIRSYNEAFGVSVLHCFGNTKDIWTADVISGRRLKNVALLFDENRQAMGISETWDQRKERLSQPGKDHLRNQLQLRREQAMDVERAVYLPTFYAFVPKGLPDSGQMQYLAALEHLHWMNALAVMGYSDGPLDDLTKHHPDMQPYPTIQSDDYRNMGLLAVKSMLKLKNRE